MGCLRSAAWGDTLPRMNTAAPLPDALSSAWLELSEVQSLLLRGYPGVVLLLAPDGRLLGANPAAAERLGRTEDAPDAGPDNAALSEPLPIEGESAVSRTDALQPGAEHDWTLRHRDGAPQPTRLAISALNNLEGDLVGLMAVEPWPRGDAEATPLFLHHDTLTGLPTRAVLVDRAEVALQRAARQKTVVAVLVVEIAGFDELCRTHGRSVGDDVLRSTASRLHFELRKTDTAVRFDGGQFVVLLVDLHQPEEATQVAEKIRHALSAKVNVGVAVLPLAARIGVAWNTDHGDQLLPLIAAAESALGDIDGQAGGVARAAAPTPA